VKLLGGDAALKLVSVALAVGLWFVIAGKPTAERGLAVPVELRNVPRDLELTGDPVNTVDVRVRASPGLINSLDPGAIRATIDLAGALEGERIVQLGPDQIQAPQGFRVVKITPSLLTLNLERTVRKKVPVRPRVIGRPAAGFEIAEITSNPAEVQISGPRSRVQEVESAFTEPVSVAGAETTVTDTVNVGLEDPLLRLEGGGSRVRVRAVVREAHETRTFDALPVEPRGRAARLSPSRVSVSVTGPASQVRGLAASDLQAYVAMPAQGPVPGQLPVAVQVASGRAGVSVVGAQPPEVSVRLLHGSAP
jgi:YbbR domain-containing protein